jgi:hypothetical protein
MRILVSFEDNCRAYRGVIAAVIGIVCPHGEVETTDPDAIAEETTRFEPEVVTCGRPGAANSNDGPALGSNSP